ncbi:tetratricopeptide repeat protein [Adhaeribacter swui]|uniref:Tetratricopeptide repeat protein n=1 Tax=Adhaeribacter swui TaxID=2086471 RepID=A0A7G7G2R0_9BACT|nr:tetratricopeptide repeat protein [Adhaeribacter swui]QNF31444.1 tetratricopeptide repeat protein [Adhaeribacter swui]
MQVPLTSWGLKLPTPKPDSNYVKQLLDSGAVLETTNPKAALKLYAEIDQLSQKINYQLGQAKALHYRGIVFSDRSNYPAALVHYKKALQLYRKLNYKRGIGACYTNMGNLYRYQSKFDSALVHYQISIDFFKKYDQYDALSLACGNAGGIFMQMQQPEQANRYFIESLQYAKQAGDSSLISRALINQGTALYKSGKKEAAADTYKKALQMADLIQDYYALYLANINLADYYKQKKQYTKAIEYGQKSLTYALKLDTPYDVADIKRIIGDLYLANNKPEEAQNYYLQAIDVSEKIKAPEISAAAYSALQELYAIRQDYKKAYKYQQLAQQYQDSMLGEKQLKFLNELEVKYQTAQKDKELAQKQLQLQKNQQFIVYSVGAAVIALLVALLLYLHFRHKNKVYQRQLKEVEQQKEIMVLQALMQGEEKERTRIARDLHDEVAGMLAAAKMHMNALVLQAKEIIQHKGYRQVVELLDEATVSVRKTAHNLMPEVLMQHGLDEALRRFCSNISNDKLLVVQYYSFGDFERFAPNFELSVYRIVQELLNNIIKHAQASETMVQLTYQDQVLSITIEDNGVGFDAKNLSKTGTGMSSIKSRVHALKGKIDIDSEPGQGVSTYIEFETALYALEVEEEKKVVLDHSMAMK